MAGRSAQRRRAVLAEYTQLKNVYVDLS